MGRAIQLAARIALVGHYHFGIFSLPADAAKGGGSGARASSRNQIASPEVSASGRRLQNGDDFLPLISSEELDENLIDTETERNIRSAFGADGDDDAGVGEEDGEDDLAFNEDRGDGSSGAEVGKINTAPDSETDDNRKQRDKILSDLQKAFREKNASKKKVIHAGSQFLTTPEHLQNGQALLSVRAGKFET